MAVNAHSLGGINTAQTIAAIAVFPAVRIGICRRGNDLGYSVLGELEHRSLVNYHKVDVLAISVLGIAAVSPPDVVPSLSFILV